MRTLWSIALLATGLSAQAAPLDSNTADSIRTAVLPSAKDLAWLDIPWRARLWNALKEAEANEKPVLLWAMNGHPLGCV